ncbi:MAG: aliphatic sulfonate ABC transporter substrate-binding protein [Holophaga sp.]|nr:aliphatic sulfonate ABC transporter substrate-binding protein [Holophaga sp.]
MKRCLSLLMVLLWAAALGAAGPVVRISYVKSPFNLPLIVAVKRGMIQQAFAQAGVTARFYEIDSGAKQTEAMAAGSLDIASVINTTSVILAAAGGNDVRIVSGFSRPTGLFAIVAKDPAIVTPANLKGRKVAGPKGTALHQLLAAALERAGLSMRDVAFLQMDIPAARTALLSGQVDAALLAAASVLQAQAAGAHVVASAEGTIKPQLVVAARGGFLRDHPQLVDLYVAVHRSALQWIAGHREEALLIGAREQGIDLAEARALADGSHFTAEFGPAERAALGQDMDFMLRAGMLRAPVDLKGLLRPGPAR